MKNRTVDLAEELTKRLDDDMTSQPAKASDAAVVQTDAEDFFGSKSLEFEFRKRGLNTIKGLPKEIYTFGGTIKAESDISINHDKYLAEIIADDY